jgi:hypothetical protein
MIVPGLAATTCDAGDLLMPAGLMCRMSRASRHVALHEWFWSPAVGILHICQHRDSVERPAFDNPIVSGYAVKRAKSETFYAMAGCFLPRPVACWNACAI